MEEPRTRRKPSFTANLLLCFASILVAFLMLGLIEGGLRLTGLGGLEATGNSRLKYQQVRLPLLKPGVGGDGTAILETTDPRLPYQSVRLEKKPGSLRIFAFGGSATAGLGYSPNVTFPRYLDRILEDAYPSREIEVVNLGIVALASSQVKLIVEDVARRYDADLLIVYSGNNEFLEVHAEKYALANSTIGTAILNFLMDTNLYRFLIRVVNKSEQGPSLAEHAATEEEMRLTQHAIIQSVQMSQQEIDEVVAHYEDNIAEVANVARETQTPLLLMTVASNWKWRGREDLADEWLDEYAEKDLPTIERCRAAREKLTDELAHAPAGERFELLFRRAVASETIGEFDVALIDYRASLNEDPHQRRALDAMADAVREVGRQQGVAVLDTIEKLSRRTDRGIIGFDEFYDYVHMTPRGALLVAAEIFRSSLNMNVLPAADRFRLDSWVSEELADLDSLSEDAYDVRRWMGFGSDVSLIMDRDLWKYDKMVNGLDDRLENDPADLRALVDRANASFFRVDGAKDAARGYERALAIKDDPDIRSNLEILRSQGRI